MTEVQSLNLSRVFKCDAETLFRAVAEGILFEKTGALKESFHSDFQVGGKYVLAWGNDDRVEGEYTEIKPHHRVAFTWNYDSKTLKRRVESNVEIDIAEFNGVSTLTLKHNGLPNSDQVEDHAAGWDDAMSDLRKSMRDLFAKLTAAESALDLSFRMRRTIKAPVSKVFAAVRQKDLLSQYFAVEASGDFAPGEKIIWNFKGYDPFTLTVQQVEEDELIRFHWDNAHVCMSFRPVADNQTRVMIEVTGFPPTQEGLDDSYSECDGWMDFLWSLSRFLEK